MECFTACGKHRTCGLCAFTPTLSSDNLTTVKENQSLKRENLAISDPAVNTEEPVDLIIQKYSTLNVKQN